MPTHVFVMNCISKDQILYISYLHIIHCVSKANRCSPVPIPEQATADTNMATAGSSVTLTCDTGYWFSPGVYQQTVTCDGANWNNIPLVCQGRDQKLSIELVQLLLS